MFINASGLCDTIVAWATVDAPGARAVIRVSGRTASHLVGTVFRIEPARSPAPSVARRFLLVDDLRVHAQVVRWSAPRSFTGEDVIELHVTSTPVLVERIVEALVRGGARPARPGEFTRRAFLAGRLDLTAAEAVLKLSEAKSVAEARAAARELRGDLREELDQLRSDLLDALAEMEAALDFAHEDIESDLLPRSRFLGALDGALARIAGLLARERGREAPDRRSTAVLYGPPNAGKSSLLNALVCAEAALVSDVAGTTRDPVSATLQLSGRPLELVDTAGTTARAGGRDIDIAAAGRSRAQLRAADLALVVLDGAAPLDGPAREVLHDTRDLPRIIVRQKADLRPRLEIEEPSVSVSARTGLGLEELRRCVARFLDGRGNEHPDLGPNARHRASLTAAAAWLEAARSAYVAHVPSDLVAIDLRAALDVLGEVTGAACPDEVLERIFARFCIGK